VKKVKGQQKVGDVEMVNLVEVKNSVEVEQLEYLELKKLKTTISVNLCESRK
jgi:hypothetical protein